jgi:hypothetical protein
MHLVIYDAREVEWPSFVDFWCTVYSREDEDPDRPDSQFIEHLRWPKGRLSGDDIDFLFEWKNGRKLPRTKRIAPDRMKRRLAKFNSLRGATYDALWKEVQDLTEGPVWGRFICHITNPDECPIWDQNVLRAHQVITAQTMDAEAIWDDDAYRAYMRFFRSARDKVRAEGSVPAFRRLDQALFSFGSRHLRPVCHRL